MLTYYTLGLRKYPSINDEIRLLLYVSIPGLDYYIPKTRFLLMFFIRILSRTSFISRESYLISLALIIEAQSNVLHSNLTRGFEEHAIETRFFTMV